MEGSGTTFLLGGFVVALVAVLIAPPAVAALHRRIRHRRGRLFRRSTRRSRH